MDTKKFPSQSTSESQSKSKPQPAQSKKDIITGFIKWLSKRENVVTLSRVHTTDEVYGLIEEYLAIK